MSDIETTQAVPAQANGTHDTDPVKTREAEIVAAALAWAQGNGYGYNVRQALEAVGLAAHLPRETAEVQVTIVATVTARCDATGTVRQDDAVYAAYRAASDNRADVTVTPVEPTGAPGADA